MADDRKESTDAGTTISDERRSFLTGAAGTGLTFTLVGPMLGIGADVADAQAQQKDILQIANGIGPTAIVYGGPFTDKLNAFFRHENMYLSNGDINPDPKSPIPMYRRLFPAGGNVYTFGGWISEILPAGNWGAAPDGSDLSAVWPASLGAMPDFPKKEFARLLKDNFDQIKPKAVHVVVGSSGLLSTDPPPIWGGHRLMSGEVMHSSGHPYLLLAMLCPTDVAVPKPKPAAR